MKKQILISLISLSSILTMNAQWNGNNPLWTNSNVGIGTANPTATLDINGYLNLNNQYGTTTDYLNPGYYVYKNGVVSYGMKLQYTGNKFGTMIFGPNQTDRFIGFGKVGNELKDSQMTEFMRLDLNTGNLGIGTTSPDKLLTLKADSTLGWEYSNNGSGSYHTITGGGINPMSFTVSPFSDPNGAIFKFNGNSGTKITILNGGNVGIGTITPAYKLDVCGTIRANEIKVDLTGICVPDFVFKKDFKLMSLNDLENFVTTKQHLPEIASEKEMIENGLNMKEFQMKILQKIEELTLYTIQQNKKNEKQEEELKILKAEIKKLKSTKR